jgi:Mg-chelatase subunit ChlI
MAAIPTRPMPCATECRARVKRGAAPSRLVPVPVVDLPLGATEDRVVGALDLERALSQGVKAFEPGLLARANRGFLYIDEVNLLEDHLVDLLIDVAASGENVVEREGLSVRHPARFVLVGSGNPEEGELRPQLLDRFGLSVEVKTPTNRSARRGRQAARRLRARQGGIHRTLAQTGRCACAAASSRAQAPGANRGARRRRLLRRRCAWRSAPTVCAAS